MKKIITKIFNYLKYVICIIIFLVLCFFLYSVYIKFFVESKSLENIKPQNTEIIQININGNQEEVASQEYNSSSGEVVIFVGGLSGWGDTWSRSILEFNKNTKNRYRVIVIDIPPFGFSEKSKENNYNRVSQAKRINTFIENKNLKDVIFVAHSYGAGLAAEAILQNKSYYKKFIIIDGALSIKSLEIKLVNNVDSNNNFSLDVKEKYNFLENIKKSLLSSIIRVVVHTDFIAKNRLESFVNITSNIDKSLVDKYVFPTYKKESSNKLGDWANQYVSESKNNMSNNIENYKSLSIPVRLIWGEEDTLTPIKETEILLKNVSDIKIRKLKGVGHIPMIEDYKNFDEALINSINN